MANQTAFLRVCILISVLSTSPYAAASLIWNTAPDGTLLGASGVEVSGSLFDVEFVDGTCGTVFDGCDDANDFTFNTEAQAAEASQALLDAVLLDVAQGSFDSMPGLTNGCGNSEVCFSSTPYLRTSSAVQVSVAVNWSAVSSNPDSVDTALLPLAFDTGTDANDVWARWTRQTSVPEPTTLALLGVGGALVAASRRRRPLMGQ